jgi:hypothetical protein
LGKKNMAPRHLNSFSFSRVPFKGLSFTAGLYQAFRERDELFLGKKNMAPRRLVNFSFT